MAAQIDNCRQIRLAGKINNFPCEFLDGMEDDLPRAVVAHNIMGFNGVELEDMGLRERTVLLTALFEGDNYSDYATFLDRYVANSGSVTSDIIVHPNFGFVFGKITSVQVLEDAREIASCRMRISFTENGKPAFNKLARHIFGKLSVEAPKILSACLSFISGAVSGAPRQFMDNLSAQVGMVQSSINLAQTQITSFVNSMIFPATLPGEVARAAFGLCATFEKNLDNIMSAPLASIQEIQIISKRRGEQIRNAIGANPLSDALEAAGITFAGSTLARFLDAANTPRYKDRVLPNDVLRVNRQFRLFAQPFIAANRAETSALAQAVAMLDDATQQTIKNLSGYRKVYIDAPRSIYIILLQNRIHRSKADIVLDINGIVNPNTIFGDLLVPRPDWED